MKRVLSMTRRTASSMSARMSLYWALRSSRGTCIVVLVGKAVILRFSSGAVRRPSTGSGVDPPLILEQLLDRHLAPWARGLAEDDGARRNVVRDHGPRGDERILADHDARQDHRARADPSALLHGHALEVLEALGRSADEVVVRGHHARCYEYAIL